MITQTSISQILNLPTYEMPFYVMPKRMVPSLVVQSVRVQNAGTNNTSLPTYNRRVSLSWHPSLLSTFELRLSLYIWNSRRSSSVTSTDGGNRRKPMNAPPCGKHLLPPLSPAPYPPLLPHPLAWQLIKKIPPFQIFFLSLHSITTPTDHYQDID